MVNILTKTEKMGTLEKNLILSLISVKILENPSWGIQLKQQIANILDKFSETNIAKTTQMWMNAIDKVLDL